MLGGYQMVDCKGLDLTKGATVQTITGLYAAAEEAFAIGKPVIAYNCVYGENNPVTPINCFITHVGADTVAISATLHIHIKSDDTITIADVGAVGA